MAYIDETFYESEYFGQDAGADFNKLAARASDDIDLACLNPIVVEDLEAADLLLLKKATAAQVEWYVLNGETYNDGAGVGSEAIGSYSRQVNLTQNRKPMELCPRAKSFLERTGLMFRGASLVDGGEL